MGMTVAELNAKFNLKYSKSDIKKIQKGFDGIKEGAKKAGEYAKRAGVAIAGAFTAAAYAGQQYLEGVQELVNASKRLNIPVKNLQALKSATEELGVPFDTALDAAKDLSIKLGELKKDGSDPASQALKSLGLNAEELMDLPMLERFNRVTEALRGVEDVSKRNAIANQLLGESGFQLLGSIDGLSDAYTRHLALQDEYGATIDKDVVKANRDLRKAFAEVKVAMNAVFLIVAKKVVPVLSKLVVKVREYIKNNKEVVSSKINNFLDMMSFIVSNLVSVLGFMLDHWRAFLALGIGVSIVKIAAAIKTLGNAFAVMGNKAVLAWFKATLPIALIAAAVAGLAYVIIKYWDEIGEFIGKVWDSIVSAVKFAAKKIYDFVKENWKVILAVVTGGVSLIIQHWDSIAEAFGHAWDWIKDKAIAVVDFVVDLIKGMWESITGFFSDAVDFLNPFSEDVSADVNITRRTIDPQTTAAQRRASSAPQRFVAAPTTISVSSAERGLRVDVPKIKQNITVKIGEEKLRDMVKQETKTQMDREISKAQRR